MENVVCAAQCGMGTKITLQFQERYNLQHGISRRYGAICVERARKPRTTHCFFKLDCGHLKKERGVRVTLKAETYESKENNFSPFF